jgi:glucose/arabinose dehydrogenase
LRKPPRYVVVVGAVFLSGCWGDNRLATPDAGPVCIPVPGRPALTLERVGRGLDMPIALTAPPGDERLFVISKSDAEVVILDRNGDVHDGPFLSVDDEAGNGYEQGLLALAFHPDYATNGRFFISWARRADAALVVEEWHVSGDPDRADPSSRKVLFEVDHTTDYHYGAHLAFGPDGFLYIGSGDGGPQRDPEDHGQSLDTLRGKLLRIDVDHGDPYAIPPDNPFAGMSGTRDEIYAYGLRNPWHFDFDPAGRIWIGDVGFSSREEVDINPTATPGLDFGWNVLEGDRCMDGTTTCDRTGKVDPVWVYEHTDDNCAVVLGPVYRGCSMPDRQDDVFVADFCGAWVKTLRLDDAGAVVATDEPGLQLIGALGAFGEDGFGEVYVLDHDEGTIDRIVPVP